MHAFYLTSGQSGSRPDLRSTIFREPELQTNRDGQASFRYFNADGEGRYRIAIEGIDENGNLGHQVFHYMVR